MLINWRELHTYTTQNEDHSGPWVMGLESVEDATHLKIEAQGKWKASGSVLPECGPDGLAGLKLPDDQLVIAGCRFGALIGKLGGSSANHHVPETPGGELAANEPFAIGTVCVLKLPDGVLGPLFFGFNALLQQMHITTLSIKIFGARPTS